MKKFLVRYIDKKVPGNKEILFKHIIHIEPVKEKRNKFNNKKVEHDGIEFDSKMERDYYDLLIDLQKKRGNIRIHNAKELHHI